MTNKFENSKNIEEMNKDDNHFNFQDYDVYICKIFNLFLLTPKHSVEWEKNYIIFSFREIFCMPIQENLANQTFLNNQNRIEYLECDCIKIHFLEKNLINKIKI